MKPTPFTLAISLTCCVTSLVLCSAGRAAERYLSPAGAASASGSMDDPWDLTSALNGTQRVAPGDTLWLMDGKYAHTNRTPAGGLYEIRLAGSSNQPIHLRGIPGRRVTIDGGLAVQAPSQSVWVRDLEILVSENLSRSRHFPETGSNPASYDRPWGGLNIHSGTGCKFINLVIHDCAQGVSWWSGNTESELHGCIIFDNGWSAPDRGHGHAIYTQNNLGVKTISDCLMTGGYSYTMHAYGSRQADVNNYHIEGNICWNAGRFLVGGGKPSRGIVVLTKLLSGVSMQLGYNAPTNLDCTVQGNVVVDGDLEIKAFGSVREAGNRVYKDASTGLGTNEVWLRPNRYDSNRAHLAVMNRESRPIAKLQLAPFLKPGDRFAVFLPRDIFGQPVARGTYEGPVEIPSTNRVSVFVITREPR